MIGVTKFLTQKLENFMLYGFWPDIREFENAFCRTWAISCAPITPYPTGRFFRGTLFQALRARLRSVVPTGRAGRHFATASSYPARPDLEKMRT